MWVESLRYFLKVLTDEDYKDIQKITIDYNAVRPRGERLKTFGGTASGPEPLQEMFQGFSDVINNKLDSTLAPLEEVKQGYGKLRPIHILDMSNLIGNNVVVGGSC